MESASMTATGTDNDDWEVAVDTGEFDKRLEQQEKARTADQVSFLLVTILHVLIMNKIYRS